MRSSRLWLLLLIAGLTAAPAPQADPRSDIDKWADSYPQPSAARATPTPAAATPSAEQAPARAADAAKPPADTADAGAGLDQASAVVEKWCDERIRGTVQDLNVKLNEATKQNERSATELAGYKADAERLKQALYALTEKHEKLLQVIDRLPEAVREHAETPPGWFTLDTLLRLLPLLLLIALGSVWAFFAYVVWPDDFPNAISNRLATNSRFKSLLDQASGAAPMAQADNLFEPLQAVTRAAAACVEALARQSHTLLRESTARTDMVLTAFKDAQSGVRSPEPPAGPARNVQAQVDQAAAKFLARIEPPRKKLEAAIRAADRLGLNRPDQRGLSFPDPQADALALIEAAQGILTPLAESFQTVADGQAALFQICLDELCLRDDAIMALETANAKFNRESDSLAAISSRSQAFAVRRLIDTGFLGAAEQAPNDETLSKAMERFDNDIEHFPEHLDYAWRLIALRNHLGEDRVKTLPYFGTAGLAELRERLEIRKGDWQSLFHGTEQRVAEALVGQWNGILRHLFRSRLLLQTYWPERTDPDLAFRLERAHAAVELVLHKHAIHPHPVQLLRPLAEVERPPKIIADDSRPLPPALADSPELNDAMNRLQYEQATKVVVDVAYWGVDCKVSVPEETTRTLLITRSVRGGTFQG
jgi:hypothetical protein